MSSAWTICHPYMYGRCGKKGMIFFGARTGFLLFGIYVDVVPGG